MKCPKHSELMRATFEEVNAIAGEDVAWLTPTRILNKNVERLGLASFIRQNIWNEDSWLGAIRPFLEEAVPIPDHWVAIHWVNEFLRTLSSNDGFYRGRKVLDEVPDKDNPRVGSTLYELYRFYGLIDPWTQPPSPPPRPPCERRFYTLRNNWPLPSSLNIIVPTLVRGGAERIVVETVKALRWRKEVDVSLAVNTKTQQQYAVQLGERGRLTFLSDDKTGDPLRRLAFDVLASKTPLLFTHLIGVQKLERLWQLGVRTVPVVHNAQPGWLDAPTAYNHPSVPFVVACADAVAEHLRQSGCTRPVVTLRHELQRVFTPDELASARRKIRDQYEIDDETLLVGMVGQFKAQKAYTRAIRVLAKLKLLCKAKLIILGSWDHSYGSGRAAHEAACRQALELDVINDVIMPGNVESVESHLGAFDIFLNTSIYEGLSISLLEAINASCPIVTADAGGNREVLPEGAVLIEDSSDIDAYVEGIIRLVNRPQRFLPPSPADPDFVPRIWTLLAKHGASSSTPQSGPPSGTLFITANLHVGGPAKAVVNLLSHIGTDTKNFLCVLGGISVDAFLKRLSAAQVPVLSVEDVPNLLDRVSKILHWIDHLNVRHVCFWNAPPELKLSIAKILMARDISLIDVSPGPMLFDELAASDAFQRRVCLTAKGYIERLDSFVALYRDGTPEKSIIGVSARSVRIIPRGVPAPPRFVPLPPPEALLPKRFDPNFAIGTCCRVVPDKRIEFLFDMMSHLRACIPQATLTIVGGPDSKSMDYWENLLRRVRDERLDHIRFVGLTDDVNPFLSQFKVFVMVSDRQGCPNASLEAMAMKLPVVANPSGGTAEQIVDGVNGFLVETPEQMAEKVGALLADVAMRRAFGAAAQALAGERFSLESMIRDFRELLSNRV
jgi:glycosyltransferase involved in cell wall biosynthesis